MNLTDNPQAKKPTALAKNKKEYSASDRPELYER